jgi:carbohydrate-selective porin OprB
MRKEQADPDVATSGPLVAHGASGPLAPTSARGTLDWFGAWKRLKAMAQEATGTAVSVYAESQAQTILDGPGEHRNRGVFWWNLNITQKLWTDADLILNTRGGSGHGLDPLLADRANTDWMAGEPRLAYISDVYLRQKLLDGRLTLAVGKFDVTDYFDRNEIASWNFLSYSLARNPTIPFAYHAIAGVVRYEPTEWFYAQAGVADARGSPTESGINTAFRHGEPFVRLCELGFRPRVQRLRGNYRIILWHDPRSRTRIDGSGVRHGDAGIGLSFDQQLSDKIGVFFRSGCARGEVRPTEQFWSLGAKWAGPIPGRSQDELVIGVAQHRMGGAYRRANDSAKAETLVELYYTAKASEWLSVAPYLQLILDPGARRHEDAAIAAGLRLQMRF